MSAVIERTVKINRDLARRAGSKLHRYGSSFDDVFSAALALVVSTRGMPKVFTPVPPVIEFTVKGRSFIADVKPDGDRYLAVVRGHLGCFTEGGSVEELRKYLVEVVKLAIFNVSDEVYA